MGQPSTPESHRAIHEGRMQNHVLTAAFEEKLARIVNHCEEILDSRGDYTLQSLIDGEVQNWLDSLRRANRAPHKRLYENPGAKYAPHGDVGVLRSHKR